VCALQSIKCTFSSKYVRYHSKAVRYRSCVFLQVTGNGECLFASVWEQFGFADDAENMGPEYSKEDAGIYTPFRLRLETIYGLLKLVKVLLKHFVRYHLQNVRSHLKLYVII